MTVGQVRKKVADLYHMPFNSFQLSSITRTYEAEDDDQALRNIGWAQKLTFQKNPNYSSNDSPKLLLAHNPSYINHLFLLLSKESKSYVEPVWNLLITLPPNKKMKEDISTINITDTTSVFLLNSLNS